MSKRGRGYPSLRVRKQSKARLVLWLRSSVAGIATELSTLHDTSRSQGVHRHQDVWQPLSTRSYERQLTPFRSSHTTSTTPTGGHLFSALASIWGHFRRLGYIYQPTALLSPDRESVLRRLFLLQPRASFGGFLLKRSTRRCQLQSIVGARAIYHGPQPPAIVWGGILVLWHFAQPFGLLHQL